MMDSTYFTRVYVPVFYFFDASLFNEHSASSHGPLQMPLRASGWYTCFNIHAFSSKLHSGPRYLLTSRNAKVTKRKTLNQIMQRAHVNNILNKSTMQ
jgi:hypothetical protein